MSLTSYRAALPRFYQWANRQLVRYREENRPIAQVPAGPRVMERGWVGVAAYIMIIWLLPSLEQAEAFSWDWRDSGVMHAQAVFRSLGASTATFGALGVGATFFWRHGYFRGRSWKRNFAPVFAGIALLAFTGVGDENTDVVAHFMGFIAGTLLGLGAASFDLRRLGRSGQYLSGGFALGLLAVAWYLAGSVSAPTI